MTTPDPIIDPGDKWGTVMSNWVHCDNNETAMIPSDATSFRRTGSALFGAAPSKTFAQPPALWKLVEVVGGGFSDQ